MSRHSVLILFMMEMWLRCPHNDWKTTELCVCNLLQIAFSKAGEVNCSRMQLADASGEDCYPRTIVEPALLFLPITFYTSSHNTCTIIALSHTQLHIYAMTHRLLTDSISWWFCTKALHKVCTEYLFEKKPASFTSLMVVFLFFPPKHISCHFAHLVKSWLSSVSFRF